MAGPGSFGRIVGRFFRDQVATMGGRGPFGRLVERAVKDPVQRKRLVESPKQLLAEAGVELPDELEVLSSGGIGALLAAQQRLKGHDCGLSLILVPDKIRNVFEVSMVSELFDIHGLSDYVDFFPKGASLLFGGIGPASPEDAVSGDAVSGDANAAD